MSRGVWPSGETSPRSTGHWPAFWVVPPKSFLFPLTGKEGHDEEQQVSRRRWQQQALPEERAVARCHQGKWGCRGIAGGRGVRG